MILLVSNYKTADVVLLPHLSLRSKSLPLINFRPLTLNTSDVREERNVVLSGLVLIICYWGIHYKEKSLELTWTLLAVSIIAAGIHVASMAIIYDEIVSAMKSDWKHMGVTCERVTVSNCDPFQCSEDDVTIDNFWAAKQPSCIAADDYNSNWTGDFIEFFMHK